MNTPIEWKFQKYIQKYEEIYDMIKVASQITGAKIDLLF